MTGAEEVDIEARLRIGDYDREACLAALHGKALPHALGHPLHRLCVIRGIRYRHGFGEELRGTRAVFTRALNARSIMSNIVPESFNLPDEVPYCIWHPETASETTYRELAERHPQMVYQVARACAVAGYTDLYHELDVLPDVHVAEEARECGSTAIYNAIIEQPIRFNIMNDYMRTVNPMESAPAWLNGDTAVRWTLDLKQKFDDVDGEYVVTQPDDGTMTTIDLFAEDGYRTLTFNITEDMHIDEFESNQIARRQLASRAALDLFSERLPLDLPTVQKDLLIVMAAYYGDVDRYARLRRPEMVGNEYECCIRGIYHNTFFAVWWSKQPQASRDTGIERAINARFIMNNVLSRMPCRPAVAPYLIWWPTAAHQSTYRQLAKLQPDMIPQIIHACIDLGDTTLFDELLPLITPDRALMCAAERQRSDRFKTRMQARLDSLGGAEAKAASWKALTPYVFPGSTVDVEKYIDIPFMATGADWPGPYNGIPCDAGPVELLACLPDAWKLKEEDGESSRMLDYVGWPPVATVETAKE